MRRILKWVGIAVGAYVWICASVGFATGVYEGITGAGDSDCPSFVHTTLMTRRRDLKRRGR